MLLSVLIFLPAKTVEREIELKHFLPVKRLVTFL